MGQRKGTLNGQQRAFVEVMAATNDATYAAQRAGYAQPQPRGSQNMANPAIQAAVREKEHHTLVADLLPKATRALSRALDTQNPTGVTMKAVEIVMKRAYGEEAGGIGKAPSEMSPDELAAALDKLKSELADRSRPAVIEHDSGVFD